MARATARYTIHTIANFLSKAGITNLKISRTTPNLIYVLVAAGAIAGTVTRVRNLLAGLGPEVMGRRVYVGALTVEVKNSAAVADTNNKGKKTEDRVVDLLKNLLQEYGSRDLVFKSDRKVFTIKKAVKVTKNNEKGTKKDGKGTYKKADLYVHTADGKVIPLSVKDKTGLNLSSFDSFWKEKATKLVVDWAVPSGKVVLEPSIEAPGEVKIKPAISVEATKKEAEFAAFGTDLLEDAGAIIMSAFLHRDIHEPTSKTGPIVIDCLKVYTSLQDIVSGGPDEAVWIQIRNEKGRGKRTWPLRGLKITALQGKKLNTTDLRVTLGERKRVGI